MLFIVILLWDIMNNLPLRRSDRVKSGNFGHQVNSDSGLVCLIIGIQRCINEANSENLDEMSH